MHDKLKLARDAAQYLTDHPDRKITIPELAEHFHVSPTLLKNAFRDHLNTSVHVYARNRKMEYAAGLLKNTDMTVLEVAGKTGYDNASKFARAFRDITGYTPSQYRKISDH